MAYVDYKCLESLLIEGEELIATEGIGSMITGLFKNLGRIFMNAINVIIKCFKNLFSKLKRSKGERKANNSRPVSTDRSAERDANIKKYEDEIKQIHEDNKKLHEESQADIKKRTEELEERKKKFEENSKARHEELHKAMNSLNETMKKRDSDDEASGSQITKDVIRAINAIGKVTNDALDVIEVLSKPNIQEEDLDNLPGITSIKDGITNLTSLHTTIELYSLADDKLTDANKNEICNKLMHEIKSLEGTKRMYDRLQDKIQSNIKTSNSLDSTASRVAVRLNNLVQESLIKAQALSVSLMKIYA